MRSVYIHIPFCNSICSYCDFCKMLYNDSWINTYLDALKLEIKKYYEEDEINTIYIGGGTPSSLKIEDLKKLFEILKVFKLSNNYEFTFEMNPNDVTEELSNLLKESGVNRVSLGVESFNKDVLKFLNRKHTKKDVVNAIKILKNSGHENINIDLIYAIPGQTLGMLKKDVSEALKLDVKHISAYSLIIEDNTVLKNKNILNIDEELDYKMYTYICNTLKKYDYNHYEVSNFCKENYSSIHNLTYWNNMEYYGFGLGAQGYINGIRYENTRSLNKYINNLYRLNEYFLSKKEDMENEVMLGLRKLDGINIYDFYKKFDVNIQEVFDIEGPIKNKLLVLKDKNLKIPEDKIYIMNEIINAIIKS